MFESCCSHEFQYGEWTLIGASLESKEQWSVHLNCCNTSPPPSLPLSLHSSNTQHSKNYIYSLIYWLREVIACVFLTVWVNLGRFKIWQQLKKFCAAAKRCDLGKTFIALMVNLLIKRTKYLWLSLDRFSGFSVGRPVWTSHPHMNSSLPTGPHSGSLNWATSSCRL